MSGNRTCRSKEERLRALAREQHWLVSRAQARSCGYSDAAIARLISSGKWTVVFRGVLAIFEAADPWRQRLMAACLFAGDGAAASHRSAGLLHELDGISGKKIEIWTPRSYRGLEGVTFRRCAPLSGRDARRVDGIPVTEIDRTLIDLAAVLDDLRLEMAIESAFRKGKTQLLRLSSRFDELGSRGREGSGRFRRVLGSLSGAKRPSGSALELILRSVLRKAKLPQPIKQHPIWDGCYNIDFAYPAHLIGIEVEGYDPHFGKRKRQYDIDRRNILTNLGWRILHFTWEQVVYRPDEVVSTVRDALYGPSLLPRVRKPVRSR
jgi:very-short-patch-repair endonuclease